MKVFTHRIAALVTANLAVCHNQVRRLKLSSRSKEVHERLGNGIATHENHPIFQYPAPTTPSSLNSSSSMSLAFLSTPSIAAEP